MFCVIILTKYKCNRWDKAMNGSLKKVDMQSRSLKLKNELYERCERHEMTEQECRGADEYLNKVLDVIDEYAY